MAKPIYLLTDFGQQDAYVGTMKAVILGKSPEVKVIDVCHDVRPQDVRSGSYLLGSFYPYIAEPSVIVAVVDPGVGSDRLPIAAELHDGSVLVGPDNGLFSHVLKSQAPRRVVDLSHSPENLLPTSQTFHGRDIFSPNGAAISRGVSLDRLGTSIPIDQVIVLKIDYGSVKIGSGDAVVQHIDRFGNIITNIVGEEPSHAINLLTFEGNKKFKLPLVRSFSDLKEGQMGAIVGSSGLIEIFVTNGNAAAELGICSGQTMRFRVESENS